ncbi:MAG: FGGY-family carbohydrate kinase [Roseobacter sp.]
MSQDIIIGIDAGTSVIKSVAFDSSGHQLDIASTPNIYQTDAGGAATQSLEQTWRGCAQTLRALGEKIPNLAERVLAISVTGQGDGTWLVGKDNAPVGDGWLWLDARAGALAETLRQTDGDAARYLATGTGLNACQQGVQLLHMKTHTPESLTQAECAFHCKDWLYLNLTGVRATDPSEACFTFGDFRTRQYSDDVISFYGLNSHKSLLAPICDGTQTTHELTDQAAAQTGLLQGTPVSLGFVDVICTTLGAGGYMPGQETGCTIVGTTGVHIRCKSASDVQLNTRERTGYVMLTPAPDQVAHLQTNMAGTLNIDWVIGLAQDVCKASGTDVGPAQLLGLLEQWMAESTPGSLIYHPHISEAGERGPFIDHTARASFIGLSTAHGFADLIRGAIEGLAMASRDCYQAMGSVPKSVTLTGGAARSPALRATLAATLGACVRQSSRAEAGAAGAAMMAAVAHGVYANLQDCMQDWVSPLLSAPEEPDAQLTAIYDRIFPEYLSSRDVIKPLWKTLEQRRSTLL